ncbi:MAG: hypothetical protein QHI38_02240 [Armatimonadota bacterium]|nr:hypothetical protein [Armatimonadota bacterium]
MKIRVAVTALLIAALGAAAVVYFANEPATRTQLVQAWSLLPKESYRAMGVTDPFVSWSPDSRSVVFGLYGLHSHAYKIFLWKVGDKQLEYVTAGVSPSFLSNDEIIYLKKQPSGKAAGIFRRNLRTRSESEVAVALKNNDFFTDLTGFSYDQKHKTLQVCMVEYTRFRTPGPEEYDLNGNFVRPVSSRLGEGIVDYSFDPTGRRCAIMVRERYTRPVSLQLADGNSSRGREIARGKINAVAWSPNGSTVAYAEGKEVIALNPQTLERTVVARFGDPSDEKDGRYVARLEWSPNSRYLAAFVYVPNLAGDYPLYYVLDMSELQERD